MPEETIEPMQRILRQFTKLDRGRMPCELLPVRAGEEIELNRELVVTVSATKHTVPSLGFLVWERRHKLKTEYQGLSGDQIRDIRMSGQDVTEEQRRPLVGYVGDTSPEGLDNCPAMYDAKILICEMTFVSPDHRKERIHKFGHMHLDDFVERKDRFKNELIVAAHLSTRYHASAVRRYLERAFPDMLGGRLKLWL